MAGGAVVSGSSLRSSNNSRSARRRGGGGAERWTAAGGEIPSVLWEPSTGREGRFPLWTPPGVAAAARTTELAAAAAADVATAAAAVVGPVPTRGGGHHRRRGGGTVRGKETMGGTTRAGRLPGPQTGPQNGIQAGARLREAAPPEVMVSPASLLPDRSHSLIVLPPGRRRIGFQTSQAAALPFTPPPPASAPTLLGISETPATIPGSAVAPPSTQ